MVQAAAGTVGAGEQLVKHLVEDDELHEVGRYLGAVERGMNSDLPGLVVVDAKPDRPPPPLGGHPSPADLGADSTLEVDLVDPIENRLEVETASPRIQQRVAIGLLPDQRLTPADEGVEHRTGFAQTTAGVIGYRLDDEFRGVEKHVMEPKAKARANPTKAHHRGAVVGHREPHREPQVSREMTRQRLRLDQRLVFRGQRSSRFFPRRLQIEQRKLKWRLRAHCDREILPVASEDSNSSTAEPFQRSTALSRAESENGRGGRNCS